jgi:drug/metabolite transporter (DMT)-like permease
LIGRQGFTLAVVSPFPAALALASAFIHASWNAALKGGRDRITDAFLIALGGVLTGGLLMLWCGPPSSETWRYLYGSVAIHLVYWVVLFKAYDSGELSHVYTLSRGSAPLLVAIGAAFFAHEIPPPWKALGVGFVSAGVLIVGFSPNAPLKATLWALSIGLCIGGYSLNDALGARTSNAALYLGWTTGLMSLPMIAFCAVRRGPLRLVRDAFAAPWRGFAIGVISFAGYGLVLWAQTMAPVAQVTALRETSVVFGALIAFVMLRERLGVRRWAGALIVAAGAALIAFA